MVGGPEIVVSLFVVLVGVIAIGGIIALIIWAVRSAKNAKNSIGEAEERMREMERDLEE